MGHTVDNNPINTCVYFNPFDSDSYLLFSSIYYYLNVLQQLKLELNESTKRIN